MTRSLFIGATLFATALAAGVPQPAGAFRGGGFGGFHGGGAWHASAGGGVDAWHSGGVHGEWGGTWHADGWHAGGVYAGGFHGPLKLSARIGKRPEQVCSGGALLAFRTSGH
jgi:hypothetical protein